MTPMRNSLSGIINLVLFIILIFIAVFLYNGNNANKANKEQGIFWQKAGDIFQRSLAVIDNFGNPQNSAASSETNSQDYWSNMGDKIKDEWDKSDSQANAPQTTDYSDMLKWEKTATGAEIIFTSKNGEEHKLELPFKFLSR